MSPHVPLLLVLLVPLKTTQATSHEQPMALPIGSDHPQSAFIEEVDEEDLYIPLSGLSLIGGGPNHFLQHVDDQTFFGQPWPAHPQVPLPTNNFNEGLSTPDSDMIPYLPW